MMNIAKRNTFVKLCESIPKVFDRKNFWQQYFYKVYLCSNYKSSELLLDLGDQADRAILKSAHIQITKKQILE